MSDRIRELFCPNGFECGECGGWVCESNPTPCNDTICGPNGSATQGANE